MKKTIQGFLVYETGSWCPPDKRYDFLSHDPRTFSNTTTVFIKEQSIEVDVPDDFDPRPDQIKALEKKQKAAAAAFHALTADINRQISELQAIEHVVRP